MKYDVFISYRRKSGIHQADALESKLKLKIPGCRIFMDRTEIKGEDWKKKLSESIQESCNFVVILSPGCFPHKGEGTDFFLNEIDQALRLGKTVIPVYYDGMKYENIKEYLSEIDGFHNRNHIIFDNNNTEGSVDRIIKFLKTEDEVLHERYKLLSRERTAVHQEIMLKRDIKSDFTCPVCDNRNSVTMTFCAICGYKFFDELEKSVADTNERIQERERLEKHKELWHRLQSGNSQSINELNRVFTVEGVSFKMIRVEGGPSGTFYIGETQVTQSLWEAVMGDNPSSFKGPDRPVEHVSWNDCQDFINKLNERLKKGLDGMRFRLPKEAEWEFAAKGGNKSMGYAFSGCGSESELEQYAWYNKNALYCGSSITNPSHPNYGTHHVKTRKPNELGLYDMSGNVWEWCEDTYDASDSNRVLRGGSWGSAARYCRMVFRNNRSIDFRCHFIGFRLALVQQ